MRIVILCLGLLFTSTISFASSSSSSASEPMIGTKHQAVVSPKKQKLKEKMTHILAKKLYKRAKRKAKKQGLAQPMAEFEDFVALAGAIVCIVGIISIIFSPLGGLIVAALGLLIYVLARGAGGSIGSIFS